MKLQNSFMCMSLRFGTIVSVMIDVGKTFITLCICFAYIATGYDRGIEIINSQSLDKPEHL